MLLVLGLVLLGGSVGLLWAAIPKDGGVSWATRQWWTGGETLFPFFLVSGIALGLLLVIKASAGLRG